MRRWDGHRIGVISSSSRCDVGRSQRLCVPGGCRPCDRGCRGFANSSSRQAGTWVRYDGPQRGYPRPQAVMMNSPTISPYSVESRRSGFVRVGFPVSPPFGCGRPTLWTMPCLLTPRIGPECRAPAPAGCRRPRRDLRTPRQVISFPRFPVRRVPRPEGPAPDKAPILGRRKLSGDIASRSPGSWPS
jgi:hypothetical protein